ncbi:related to budding protein BOI2 [Phialocephala subalpina]|uniref:Related to budding protein BOI2 n=1 Tax=Phialocephala subalpina TaxID=576137 RepID=A0A1L7WKN4_9HELO|nr:related to budding protein BOI2 [Phialocephala subalpina]
MASRPSIEPQGRPEPGQILIVIHDFSARSSDELSLSKGDRVELIERDDDFGDGWYLGRHLMNGGSGLFPEVYTRIAPRGPPSYPPTSTAPRSNPTTIQQPIGQPVQPQIFPIAEDTKMTETAVAAPVNGAEEPAQTSSRHASLVEKPNITSPLHTTHIPQESEKPTPTISTTMPMGQQKSVIAAAKAHAHGQDSPVMNETLSVIDEHITDMHSPHHSAISAAERHVANDSGSEYSSHLVDDSRLSYINGEETDEEDENVHTREEVSIWTSDQVAEYLFTAGVEAKHCEMFRDQEISGDVLLGMDQTSVFLKEFDLGSVGRRLKTWQKIKVLQDEINGIASTRRNTGTYGSEHGSDSTGRHGSRSISSSTMLPRIPSMNEGPTRTNTRLSSQHTFRSEPSPITSPVSPKTVQESPRPGAGEKRRPSAASIRDLHHSRQSSANEFSTASLMGSVTGDTLASPIAQDGSHKKQPSFDRNWTMGSAISPSLPSRPLSSSGVKAVSRSATDHLTQDAPASTNLEALDRGYFSGGEVEGRQRNVLKKRGSTTTHSRNSSYTDEQRLRSATAHTRHSRFGSVDSIQGSPSPAAQKYYNLSINGRRRTPSENSINAPPRPLPPPKDAPSPTVTRLESGVPESPALKSPEAVPGRGADWLLPVKPVSSRHFGLRAISDAVTGHEKSRVASPTEPVASPMKDSPMQSPSRTGSSTPSAGPSFDLDSPEAKSSMTMSSTNSKATTRKKSKKETSAYTRGLEKKTPQEQMIGADYSGWMKKKSPNLMTTWKPRLFILKGRRLSYYYSENDTEEKGLIDISFHRVLPADTDRLTGLHATLTGATNSPTSPAGATTTMAAKDAAAEPESTLSKGNNEQMFIFKLVPPRAGLTKAVTFTKPTIHYFAVPNIKQGRLWMAALMKATIDRDDSKPITTTYQQKTISLEKARRMRHRPPALMNLDEHVDEEEMKTPASDKNGLNIHGIIFDKDDQEGDSGVSGVSNFDSQKPESATGTFLNMNGAEEVHLPEPRTA